jgi:hypothetical protein
MSRATSPAGCSFHWIRDVAQPGCSGRIATISASTGAGI